MYKNLYNEILNNNVYISLVGLGYVGMPIAVSFANKAKVIGFDINEEKIQQYKNGIDPTNEVGNDLIKNTSVCFTSNSEDLRKAKFHIVAVPTPILDDSTPDLRPIKSASITLGKNLTKGSIVVYESTVYPGVTEEICVPILERESGLVCGIDFKIGYSPERINPGDKEHRIENIIKIVSGMDKETLEIVAKVYELVVNVGVHKASSIKVAEAAKVIENSQRDINIAFMNELSIIFNKLNIDTNEVLAAAKTKWNFLNFTPGLVGGHCIGVDPYYLTYKAEQVGYHSQIILAGRRINDDMGKYIVENVIKNLIKEEIPINNAKIGLLGFTFKENCPDTRNTRVIDIYNELKEYSIDPIVYDPEADANEAYHEYGIKFGDKTMLKNLDSIIIAVGHDSFKKMSKVELDEMFLETNHRKIIFDIKGILNDSDYNQKDYKIWRL